jgi:WD40 repeat protein
MPAKQFLIASGASCGGPYTNPGQQVNDAIAAVLLHCTSQVLSGHTDEIFSCAFNYEGDSIITGSKDNTCRIWKVTEDPGSR